MIEFENTVLDFQCAVFLLFEESFICRLRHIIFWIFAKPVVPNVGNLRDDRIQVLQCLFFVVEIMKAYAVNLRGDDSKQMLGTLTHICTKDSAVDTALFNAYEFVLIILLYFAFLLGFAFPISSTVAFGAHCEIQQKCNELQLTSLENLLHSYFKCMGCTSTHPPQENYTEPQQYYTTATSKNNVLSHAPSTKYRQLPRDGTITEQRDKYEEAKQMMAAYPSYREPQQQQQAQFGMMPQDSMRSAASRESSVALLCDKIELNLSLRNIPKLDLLSPSDPFIIVSMKDERTGAYLNVGKTEIVWDNPNADFSKDIRINYLFEEIQYVKLDIYDADEQQTTQLSKHDYIGCAEFIVGDLVTAPGQKLVMAIEDRAGKKLKKVKGMQPLVIVRAQEIDDNYDEVEFEFAASGLPKMDTFGKIDPFFQLYRYTDDGQWASVYKSEHIAANYNPRWKPFKIETRRLCHGDMNRPIMIKCWDWNRDARPDYACEIKTTLAQLIDVKQEKWQQWDYKKQRYKAKNCGELLIKRVNIVKRYSFVSYLKGGLELQLLVAIDFTGSNGDPRDRNSLHYMGPPQYESQYMKVIKSVGRVLAPYDADGAIGAYGFGANLDPMGKRISHCFNLTLRPNEEEVDGIDGLCEAYTRCLNNVQLYGPTYFSEILQNAAAKASGICSQKSQSYYILLIITDGVINDMQRSINAIVEATRLPLSIIIVGVGNANFDNMEILDADDVPLKHSQTGRIMQRDIVQFVPFNEFKEQHISAIARETLEEVPGQVTSFMGMHHFHPNPPRDEPSSNVDNLYANINLDGNDEEEAKTENNFYPDIVPTAPYGQNPYYATNGNNSNGQEGAGTVPGANPLVPVERRQRRMK